MLAGIYTRISNDPTGKEQGVQRQSEDCHALANTLGWQIVDTYTDNDTSATSTKPRPHYKRMLTDIQAGRINAIIVWHADRLYRKITDLVEIVDIAKTHNLAIATVRAGHIDLTTPTGRLVAGLLATVATYEGEQKSDRWKRAVEQNRAAGKFTRSAGRRLYGYTREGVIIPTEAAHIRAWATDVINGRPLGSIVTQAQHDRITTSTGGPWSVPGLRQLLTRPRLAALNTLRGTIVGPGEWEPILTPEEHHTLARIFDQAKTGPAPPRIALLPGMIFCGTCHNPLNTGSRANSGGRRTRTYRCSRLPGTDACQKISGTAVPIEDYVEAYAQEKLTDPDVRARLAALPVTPDTSDEIAQLDLRIAELEHQLDQPGVPIQPLVDALTRTTARRAALIAAATPLPAVPLPELPLMWPTELFRRRQLVELVIERVDLMPSTGFGKTFDTGRLVVTPR